MMNYYDTLGVSPQATQTEIKASFRQLAKVYHPDMSGGDALRFASIKEAYEVLSTPHRRQWYDRQANAAQARAPRRSSRRNGARPFRPQASSRYTRIMSIAISRAGLFSIERLTGSIAIQPTTPDNLWQSTLDKFGEDDPRRLSRHIIQIKVTGDRDHVRAVYPVATEVGIAVERQDTDGEAEMFGRNPAGARQSGEGISMRGGIDGHMGTLGKPLHIQATVPKGIALQFDDIQGPIDLGDQEAELVARLHKANLLRAGRLAHASLILRDHSRAHVAHVEGNADVMSLDRSRALLGGRFERFRCVIEQQGLVEILGPVEALLAEVHGMGYLNARNKVADAHLDIGDNGLVQIARLLDSLQGTRSGNGRVKVLSRQFRIPFLHRFATRGYEA
ncbi:MAG: J domain-containing protein [Candidatus Lambdaproteobacteria bacterium]|nr:J domain-containing protein [Candidatus Lambdaproteobacteria bacterium]